MSKIKITLPEGETPVTGKLISFIAPCACEVITGIAIDDAEFSLVDAYGNDVSEIYNVFSQGALVSVILDTTNHKAYIQNAANTKYAAYYEIPLSDGSVSIQFEYQKKYRIYASMAVDDEGDSFDCGVALYDTNGNKVVSLQTYVDDIYHSYFDLEILYYNYNTKVLVYSINGKINNLTLESSLIPYTLQVSDAQKILVINI